MIGFILALIGTGYSAWTDIRTGYVEDWLSHAMIACGIALVIFTLPLSAALWALATAAIVFAAGFAAYSFGQIGGGDVKLFTAIALLVPQQPVLLSQVLGVQPAAAVYPFIASVFVLSGILYMYVIPVVFLRKIFSSKDRIKGFEAKLRRGGLYAGVLVPVFAFWTYISPAFLFLVFPMAATMLLAPFKDDAVKLFFASPKPVSRLDEDDVLALESIPVAVKKKLGLWRKTFTNRELDKIKSLARKAGVRNLSVCENLPKFVPYIFASLLLTSVFGDLLLWLITHI